MWRFSKSFSRLTDVALGGSLLAAIEHAQKAFDFADKVTGIYSLKDSEGIKMIISSLWPKIEPFMPLVKIFAEIFVVMLLIRREVERSLPSARLIEERAERLEGAALHISSAIAAQSKCEEQIKLLAAAKQSLLSREYDFANDVKHLLHQSCVSILGVKSEAWTSGITEANRNDVISLIEIVEAEASRKMKNIDAYISRFSVPKNGEIEPFRERDM